MFEKVGYFDSFHGFIWQDIGIGGYGIAEERKPALDDLTHLTCEHVTC